MDTRTGKKNTLAKNILAIGHWSLDKPLTRKALDLDNKILFADAGTAINIEHVFWGIILDKVL